MEEKKVELTAAQQTALAEYMNATRVLAAAQRSHEQAKQRYLQAQQAWQATILEG